MHHGLIGTTNALQTHFQTRSVAHAIFTAPQKAQAQKHRSLPCQFRHLEKKPDLPSQWDQLWKSSPLSPLALLRQLYAAALYKLKKTKQGNVVPTLFVVSKEDRLVPWQNTVALWEHFPHAELRVFEHLGHDLTTDEPELLKDVLIDFCQRQEK